MTSDDFFVAPNKTPAKWCTGGALGALFANNPRVLRTRRRRKHRQKPSPGSQARYPSPTDVKAVGGVVTDQGGRWLRYERLMDQAEYGAIVGSKWYRLGVLDYITSLTLPTGSLESKSAWKILTPAEIALRRYYTTTATVYNTPETAKSPGKNPVTLGLVGLHIIQKTPQQAQFFWSTFEQVDNESVFFNPGSNDGDQQANGEKAVHRTQVKRRADQSAGTDQARTQDCGEPRPERRLPKSVERFGFCQLSAGQHAVARLDPLAKTIVGAYRFNSRYVGIRRRTFIQHRRTILFHVRQTPVSENSQTDDPRVFSAIRRDILWGSQIDTF